MEKFHKVNIKIRNIALILILIAIIILIIWIIHFLQTQGKELQVLLAIGIALFLAGILMLTRIQYIIWMEKKFSNNIERASKLNNF